MLRTVEFILDEVCYLNFLKYYFHLDLYRNFMLI